MNIQKAYDEWAQIYDTNLNKTRDLDQQVTVETLSKFQFETVLELGCGTGKNTQWLLSQGKNVLAIDFSDGMLQKAKEKIHSDKVKFYQADINKNWDFTSLKFDVITCNLILEHIGNLDFIFHQAARKLEMGGKFFICELHPFKQYSGTKARYESEKGVEELEVFIHHLTDFTENALKNNFKILEIKEWFHPEDSLDIPRLISFVFEKN